MWANFPFARPVSSFEAPVPVPAMAPDVEPFAYFRVNKTWVPYILGALKQLVLQSTWDVDTGPELDLAQEWAMNLLAQWSLNTAAPTETVIFDGDLDMTSLCDIIRVENGKIQLFCCGHWEDAPGQEGIAIASGGQPSVGADQPAPGETGCSHFVMGAGGTALVPVPVSTGDVITVSGASGAISNSHTPGWHGPDGRQFFAGEYVSFTQTDAANPVPSAPTSSLIIKLGGVWYALGTGTITVPGGISGEQAEIQVNDNNLAGLGGDFTFDVCVQNNAIATWSHTFDFTLNDGGFTSIHGVYVLGQGWQSTYGDEHAGWNTLRIYRAGLPSSVYNAAMYLYNSVATLSEAYFLDGDASGGTNDCSLIPLSSGSGIVATGAFPDTTQTRARIDLTETATGANNLVVLPKVTLSGKGTNPFI